MHVTTAQGIEIAYETFGDRGDPALLLIMGLGCPMICWDDLLCKRLAGRRLFVIRFDNRDCGRSTKMSEAANGRLAYALQDMANDAVGLLDHLGLHRTHVCGMSMGAEIGQLIASGYPGRVVSFIQVSGTTGNPELEPPDSEAWRFFEAPCPRARDEFVRFFVDGWIKISGKKSFDARWHQELGGRIFDCGLCPEGQRRQLAAIVADGDRRGRLEGIAAPTLIIHGAEDPILHLDAGLDAFRAISHAKFMVMKGLGHDLPHGAMWEQLMDFILVHMGHHSARLQRSP